jgi:ATP-dependent DNA ligase
MPLASLHAPFDHPDWIFELKYDGCRALAYVDSGECRLVSRRAIVYKSFPHIGELGQQGNGPPAGMAEISADAD